VPVLYRPLLAPSPPPSPHCLHYSFFVQCCDRLPDLHSFPTRRSSDLFRSGWIQLSEGSSKKKKKRKTKSDRQILRHPVIALGKKDRKSTRLNSSHVSISYAVFCLKKKRETKTQHDKASLHPRRMRPTG